MLIRTDMAVDAYIIADIIICIHIYTYLCIYIYNIYVIYNTKKHKA